MQNSAPDSDYIFIAEERYDSIIELFVLNPISPFTRSEVPCNTRLEKSGVHSYIKQQSIDGVVLIGI